MIQPEDLNGHRSNWVILDGRPKKVWEKAHVPDALSFSWEEYTQTDEKKIPYRVLPPEKLSQVLGNMGIDEHTPIVVYGDADTSWGGEGWVCWVLTWIGHKGPIRLLSGGVQKWQRLDYPLETQLPVQNRPSVKYTIHLQNHVNLSSKEIMKNMANAVWVDTRSTREWLFEEHVPGAVHITWKKYYNRKDSCVIGKEAFFKLMTDNGIRTDTTVIYYCTGGIRSAYVWFVHELWSESPAMNFEGGMEAWKRRE